MKTIIEMALRDLENAEIATNSTYESTMLIREALAQPEMRPDEISTDELIYMNGLYDGMKQERALWTLSKLGQEIEAQPQRPWAGLTDEERASFEATLPKTQKEWDDLFNGIEAKLKEKNFD
jgi:hypothetical protein